MSLLKCDNCGGLIDTDDHPEAYDEHADKWQCQLCSTHKKTKAETNEITEIEEAVLRAAFDLCIAQIGLDHGVPMQSQQQKAYRALMDACADVAAENDGELVIRSDHSN